MGLMAPVIAFHRACWRLRAQSPVAPLARLAGAADLGPLQGLIRRTAVQPRGSRFSDGSFHPLYAALAQHTCVAEITFHWARTFREAGCPPGTPFHTWMLSVASHGEDFLDVRQGHEELHEPDSYLASQRFGLEAYVAGRDGILYRSVRDPGGTCVAALRPQAAGMPGEQRELRFIWAGERFEAGS